MTQAAAPTTPPAGDTLDSPPDRDAAVAIRALSKRYGDRTAVDRLALAVPRGRVTGFVGPNGAGKTTTIRMLLGLVRPSGGEGHVLGHPIADPAAYLHRVGALIESPAFYPSLSGRDNLRVLATLGRIDRSRLADVLDRVDLTARAGDPVRAYSLGMKQRLGIAAALLPHPELLILDEPTNGLDPAGIREIRALLRRLADAGMTVLVSSHLLNEIEAICDHVVLIKDGRTRFQGGVAELLRTQQSKVRAVPVEPADLERVVAFAHRLEMAPVVAAGAVVANGDGLQAARLNELAAASGVVLMELRTQRPSLEDAFFALTGEQEQRA